MKDLHGKLFQIREILKKKKVTIIGMVIFKMDNISTLFLKACFKSGKNNVKNGVSRMEEEYI